MMSLAQLTTRYVIKLPTNLSQKGRIKLIQNFTQVEKRQPVHLEAVRQSLDEVLLVTTHQDKTLRKKAYTELKSQQDKNAQLDLKAWTQTNVWQPWQDFVATKINMVKSAKHLDNPKAVVLLAENLDTVTADTLIQKLNSIA